MSASRWSEARARIEADEAYKQQIQDNGGLIVTQGLDDRRAMLDAIDAVLALPRYKVTYAGPEPGAAQYESGYESGWSDAMEAVRGALGVEE